MRIEQQKDWPHSAALFCCLRLPKGKPLSSTIKIHRFYKSFYLLAENKVFWRAVHRFTKGKTGEQSRFFRRGKRSGKGESGVGKAAKLSRLPSEPGQFAWERLGGSFAAQKPGASGQRKAGEQSSASWFRHGGEGQVVESVTKTESGGIGRSEDDFCDVV